MRKLLTPIIFFALFSCAKKTDTPAPLTAQQKISSGPWKYKSIVFASPVMVKATGQYTTDGLIVEPCASDDQNPFNQNGTVLENDGVILCGSTQIVTGNWSLVGNNQMLWDNNLYTITQNDGNTLIIVLPATASLPAITTTFAH